MTRLEELLTKLINGESLEGYKCTCRLESHLINCINRKGLEGLPSPKSRLEALLQALAVEIQNGGGTKVEGDIKITANGTHDVSTYANAIVDVPPTSGYSLKEAVLEFAKESGKSYYNSIDADYLFAGFSGDVSKFMDNSIFEQLSTFNYMFYKAYPSVKMPDIIINNSKSNSLKGFFSGFTNRGGLPNLLKWDKAGQIVFSEGFADLNSQNAYIDAYPIIDFPNCTELWIDRLFYNNQQTTKAPDLPYNIVRNMDYAFYNCFKLKDLSNLAKYAMNNVNRFDYCFYYCRELVEVPPILSPNLNGLSNSFHYCDKLETIHGLNLMSVFSTQDAFKYCEALTNLTLYNIKRDLQIASGTKWGHKITKESLIQIISELIDTGSSKRLTMGSTNTAKLADVYVRLTGAAEEDEANPKLPFEICEASDEGAMLITNYVTLKNWSLS